jgi:hypothetical protein
MIRIPYHEEPVKRLEVSTLDGFHIYLSRYSPGGYYCSELSLVGRWPTESQLKQRIKEYKNHGGLTAGTLKSLRQMALRGTHK